MEIFLLVEKIFTRGNNQLSERQHEKKNKIRKLESGIAWVYA